ncbi:outer membrane beta-barrel protein [Panacibacter sp. DH6]|uniref:Outer membrane beta-barrel protein n=1 Tax=Panacibacter microcysteis TaxID=2793269 RepID=A0A931GZ61_9BACT|nr:DUF6089 family protein [Panacibacter microcysteis]MBG9378047.1 outer membrane beta-barrel protein [Panacibacter microcysteis]
MKKAILFAITLLTVIATNAQRFHVNLLGGVSNYAGELEDKSFTLQRAKPAVALGLSYELTNKLFLRGQFTYTNLGADDKNSKIYSHIIRNLNFKTILQEVNLVAEYDILDNYTHKLVPYVFAGVGVYRFSPYTFDTLGRKAFLRGLRTEGQGLPNYPDRQVYRRTHINIPVGGGVKLALSDNIKVAAEFSLRNLFTDYLDDVSTNYPDLDLLGSRSAMLSYRGDELKPPIPFPGEGALRGNPDQNDAYYFLMFRISYRLPFGNSSQNKTSGKYYKNCPPVKL